MKKIKTLKSPCLNVVFIFDLTITYILFYIYFHYYLVKRVPTLLGSVHYFLRIEQDSLKKKGLYCASLEQCVEVRETKSRKKNSKNVLYYRQVKNLLNQVSKFYIFYHFHPGSINYLNLSLHEENDIQDFFLIVFH